MNTSKGNKGGKRPGAGRPANLATQIKKAESLAKQLQAGTGRGLELLAAEYPELMKKAIEYAKGGDKMMLRELIRLLPSMTTFGSEGDGKSTLSILIQTVIANQTVVKEPNEDTPLAGDSKRIIEGAWRPIEPEAERSVL